MTGDDGRFSIGNLGSGSYTLMARAPLEWEAPDPVEKRKLAWLPTYYPSIGFREAAGKIAVNSGTEVTGLEIKLLSGPVYYVRGVVLTPAGDAAPDAVVDLDQASHQTGDGAFDFETADGEWQIQARAQDGETELRAYRTVRVAGHDQDGLKLLLEAPFSIHGRLWFDPPLPKGTPLRKTVGLGAADRSQWRGSTEPDEDGNFTIENVYPGVYNVSAPLLFLSGYYLESIRLGSQDALGVEVEFRSGFQPLEVRLKGGGGTVRGTVEDSKEAWVVLVPMDLARRRVELTGWGFCDATGRYEIANVRPGDYYAIAATEQSQVFLSAQGIPAGQEGAIGYGFGPRLINQATRVSVGEGETSLVDLKVVKTAGQ